jgi:tetratricopeptide (TPR) repeat protein
MQMIESKKYSEAKEAIELAVWNDRTANWPRTYYAKGLLCQSAYEEGKAKKNSKLTSLYDDQLYLAWESYEKALELDTREKIHSLIGKKYYSLSNAFLQLGQEHYTKKEYKEAFKAFEHALLVMHSDLVKVEADTNLVYNTALAAYNSKNWQKAIAYLRGLHEDSFSTDASLLLVNAYLNDADTLQAEEVMLDGLGRFNYSETLVMYYVNWLTDNGRNEEAIEVLQQAITKHADNFRFHWALGLVHSDLGNYPQAIESLEQASKLSQEVPPELYYQVGMSYYNIGIDLREEALLITENKKYMEVRDQYMSQFREALKWLELSYELDPGNENTIKRLYQLYYQLQMKEKQEAFERLMQ